MARGIKFVSKDGPVQCFVCPANGMKIVWVNDGQGKQMVVHRLIESGSQCEDYTNLGATHALEHFFFKDGAPWGRFASHGANLNAYTSTKYLVTTAQISNDQLRDWLAYQAECMRGKHMLNLDHDQIASEIRNVIDEMERNKSSGNLLRKMITIAREHCLLQGNKVPTIGEKSTLRAIVDGSDIRKLQTDLLGPSRNTLMIVGQFDKDALLDCVEEQFSKLPRNTNLRPFPLAKRPSGKGMTTYDIRESAGATALAFAWPCPAYCHDVDLLDVVFGLLSGPAGAHTYTEPLKKANVIYQCMCEVPQYSTPDVMYIVVTIPCSKEVENQAVARAYMSMISVFMALQQFNDTDMLQATLRRMQVEHANKVGGDQKAMAEACSCGIKAGMPSLNWHYASRFSPNNVTPADIREVARKYLTEHDMCVVRYLQTELPPSMGHHGFPLKPSFGHISPHGSRSRSVASMPSTAPLAFDDYVTNEYGMRICRHMRPYNTSHISYVFPAHGIKSPNCTWGRQTVMHKALQSFFPGNKAISDMGGTLKWKLGKSALVATMECDSGMIDQACKAFSGAMDSLQIPMKDIKVAIMRSVAISNGQRFDAGLNSRMAYMNKVYLPSHYNYIVPFDQRVSEIRGLSADSVHHALSNLVGSGGMCTCVINMTEDQQANAYRQMKSCSKLSVMQPSGEHHPTYSPLDTHVNLPHTPSLNVCFAQPCKNITASNAREMAHLELACNILGNGFVGTLMTTVRDKYGLTYSISPSVSIGETPSFMVNATFNKNALKQGTELTLSLLNDWTMGAFTDQQLEQSRDSILGAHDIHSFSIPSVMNSMITHVSSPFAFERKSYYTEVAQATLQDVQGSIQNFLQPKAFSVSVAGSLSSASST